MGVSKTATEGEIKTAYRKLARRYHPDVNKDSGAEDKFKEVNEAYQVLSDPKSARNTTSLARNGSVINPPADSQVGLTGADGSRRRKAVSLDTAQFRRKSSATCLAVWAVSRISSTRFLGKAGSVPGLLTAAVDLFRVARRELSRWNTRLRSPLEEAYTGTKRTLQFEDGRKIEASIPQGVRTGSKVRLSGQAGGADLFLKIKVLPHRNFTRKGDDLIVTVPVDIYTAILGGEVSVDTLGKPVRLTIPEGTDSGKTMRLKGLGMPKLKNPSEHGDLYAHIELHLPGHLTPAEKEKIREIRNMRHA